MAYKLVHSKPRDESTIISTAIDQSWAAIPTPIFRSKELSSDAKITYGILEQALSASRPPTEEEIADAAGLDLQRFRAGIAELVKLGLVRECHDPNDSVLGFEIVNQHPIFIEGYVVQA